MVHALRFFISALMFILCFIQLPAQKIKTEIGESQLRVEENITFEQAKLKAIELAKIDAIQKAFNTYIEQETNTTVTSGKSDFRMIGKTKVRGEWIKTLEGPSFKDFLKDGQRWITCTIKGKIKEALPKASIVFNTLSCPALNCRSTTFYSGEQLYLYFKSPLDGYLSVYLDDGEKVNRLLPYENSPNQSSVQIKGDKDNFFFARSKKDLSFGEPDEMVLITAHKKEFNTLIIVFSEKNYLKPILKASEKNENGEIFPRSITRENFEEWLSENRATIDDFQDQTTDIEIIASKRGE